MFFGIKVLFEIIAVLLITYGIIHEDELIELEDVLLQWAKRGFKKGRGSKCGFVQNATTSSLTR